MARLTASIWDHLIQANHTRHLSLPLLRILHAHTRRANSGHHQEPNVLATTPSQQHQPGHLEENPCTRYNVAAKSVSISSTQASQAQCGQASRTRARPPRVAANQQRGNQHGKERGKNPKARTTSLLKRSPRRTQRGQHRSTPNQARTSHLLKTSRDSRNQRCHQCSPSLQEQNTSKTPLSLGPKTPSTRAKMAPPGPPPPGGEPTSPLGPLARSLARSRGAASEGVPNAMDGVRGAESLLPTATSNTLSMKNWNTSTVPGSAPQPEARKGRQLRRSAPGSKAKQEHHTAAATRLSPPLLPPPQKVLNETR